MKLYLDTGNIEEIKEIAEWGILSGVTTNPTLLSKEKGNYRSILKEICDIVKGPVSGEVISTDVESMVKEAEELANISEHIVVKIPMIIEGIKTISRLSKMGIKTNATLVFSPNQALLAASAGANYISPFVGRMEVIGHKGEDLIKDILLIIKNYNFSSEIIFASVRHPRHVLQAARLGTDIATIPYSVFKKLVHHPMTDIGLKKFIEDWNRK